jgi:nitrogen fixation-related uncharacterized protein
MEELLETLPTPEAYLCPAAAILLKQIDKRWPDREKQFDDWTANNEKEDVLQDHNPTESGKIYALDIDTRMGPRGKMRDGLVADELANQILDYVKRGVPGSERIDSVVYKNQIASGHYKDRFWVWRKGNYGCEKHIHIVFKKLGYEDPRDFQLNIFRAKDQDPEMFTVKEKAEVPKYPGKEKLIFGNQNESVRRMQKQLLAKNYYIPSGATGKYDDQTRAAIRLLYHKMRKNSSGKDVGPSAWKFLFEE